LQVDGDGGVTLDWPARHLQAFVASLATVELALVLLGRVPVTRPADVTSLLGELRRHGWLAAAQLDVRVHARQGAADRARWLQAECHRQLGAQGSTDAPVLHLRVGRGDVEVAMDAVGEPLARRGYRLEGGAAPLRETHAAALLRWAGYQPGMALWDPTCGSGTLLIEAALLGQPVRSAPLACRRWPGLEPQQAIAIAPQPGVSTVGRIEGGDLDPATVAVAQRNLERAGLGARVEVLQRELGQWREPPSDPRGLVVSNLPWGVRLSHRSEARRLAERWAAVVRRRVPGWHAAAVVPEPQWGERLGLQQTRVLEVRHGGRTVWWLHGRVPV
jgi:23S rRNA G2445 N2-methylase RlmL